MFASIISLIFHTVSVPKMVKMVLILLLEFGQF
jgi:hypothetical protein